MKCFLSALLATLAAPALAQSPPVPPQPSSQAVVTAKSESDGALSLTLDGGKSTLTQDGQLSTAQRKAFRQLQIGRAYVFPDAFQVPADDSADFTQVPLLSLKTRTPFRALVDHIDVADERVSLRLCCADGSKIEYLHVGTQDLETAKALVANLQLEETYEFPAVVLGQAPAPPPAEWEPLEQYVGEWRGTLDGEGAMFITMRCAWRADGKGLWREIMFDDASDAEPVRDVAIMTVDKAGQILTSDPRDANKLPATGSYDAATKTFSTRLPAFQPGIIRRNTATFTTADLITWKTMSRNEMGAVLSTSSGTYRRLTRKPSSAAPSAP